MLDQMSGGRFLYGVGRGISPIEVGFYGVDFATGTEQFREAFEVDPHRPDRGRADLSRQVLRFRPRADRDEAGCRSPIPSCGTAPAGRTASRGRREHGAHIVTLRDTAQARAIIDLYKAEWRKLGRAEADLPLMGINRHIVVADSEAEARDIARRAYPRWRQHMERLWAKYNVPFPLGAVAAARMGRAAGAWPRDRRHAGPGARLHRRARSRRRRDLFRLRLRLRHDQPSTRRCARPNCSRNKSCRPSTLDLRAAGAGLTLGQRCRHSEIASLRS